MFSHGLKAEAIAALRSDAGNVSCLQDGCAELCLKCNVIGSGLSYLQKSQSHFLPLPHSLCVVDGTGDLRRMPCRTP